MLYAVQIFFFLIILLPKITFLSVPGSGVGIRWDDFAVALLALWTVVNFVIHPESRKVLKDRISLVFLAFLGWGLIATVAGIATQKVPNTTVGLMYWGRLVQFYLMYLMARSCVWDLKAVKRLVWLLLSSVVLVMAFAWGQFAGIAPYYSTLTSLLPTDVISYESIRVLMSTFGGHYDFGIFIVMVLCYALSALFFGVRQASSLRLSRKQKIWFYSVVSLIALSAFALLILTKSRSAYISLVAVLFALGLLYQPILIGVSAVVSSVLGFLFFKGKLSTFSRAVSFGQSYYSIDMSTYERLQKWMAVARDITLLSLFTGHGLSSLGPAVDGYYVRTLGEIGMIGLSIFIYLLFTIFRRCVLMMREKPGIRTFAAQGVFLCLIAITVQAVFIDTFVSSKVMYVFWILVGITTALPSGEEREGSSSEKN